MDDRGPGHVAIVGASLAGLFAAGACAGSGRRVVVLERDRLPAEPVARPGVPQGTQPHVILHRGMLAIEELFPGISGDLERVGAVSLDTGQLAWLAESGWALHGLPAFPVVSVSRPLLEHVVRQRVLAMPGVEIRDDSRVMSVRRHDTTPTWLVELAGGDVIDADVLVDASGRSSRLPRWLEGHGLGQVAVTEVNAHVGYATRVYAVPEGAVAPAGVVIQLARGPLKGGMALPVEDGKWLLTATGVGDWRPPRDVAGFERFLRELPDPAVAEVASLGRPVGEVHVHRQTANRRHAYERLRRWPPGLLVVGDALCAFNPVYGQGITVAACQAVELRDGLARGARSMPARRLQRNLARWAAFPWAVATGQDLSLPTSEGSQSLAQSLFGAWAVEVGRLAAHGNVRASTALARIYHLMASPRALLHPALVAASVLSRLRGAGPANPRPLITASSPLADRVEKPAADPGTQPALRDADAG